MDKRQAEAIVQAVLEPDLKAQEELRDKRMVEDRSLAVRRSAAAFVLVGFALGAAAAYFAGERVTVGGLLGCFGGALVGWAVGAWRVRQRAA